MALPSPHDHGRDKNKEKMPIYRLQGRRQSSSTCRKAISCVRWRNCPTQLPHWPPEGWKGSETPSRLASHAWPANKSPSLLIDQDLVINFATYTRVYTVIKRTASLRTFKYMMLHKALAVRSRRQLLAQQITSLYTITDTSPNLFTQLNSCNIQQLNISSFMILN